MTKRFIGLSSLFAVVAMFLALMATGCSEGDNTPAETVEGALVNTTVGFAAEKADVPSATEYMAVSLLNDSSKLLLEQAYGKKDAVVEGVEVKGWYENSDGTVTMPLVVDEATIAKNPTRIVVIAVGKDLEPLGLCVTKDVTIEAGSIVDNDLTEDTAPAFINFDDITAELTIDQVDDNDTISVVKNDTTETITGKVSYYYKEELVVSYVAEGMTLKTDSTDITVNEDNTITGNEIGQGNVVNAECDGAKRAFTVDVVGLGATVCIKAGEAIPDFANGDYVEIKLTVNEVPAGTEIWTSGETCYVLENKLGLGDKVEAQLEWYHPGEKHQASADAVLEEVVYEADANRLLVEMWDQG